MLSYRSMVLAVCLSVITSSAGAFTLTEKMVSQAVVSEGNQDRLQNLFRKAEQGKTIVIGTIGGSITMGGAASSPEKAYPQVMLTGWKKAFPKTKFTLINAGIGATGSGYGAMRVRRDLLVHQPDLVIVEYAVNDADTREVAESYEGLGRQILSTPEQPALVLLFMTRQEGNSQEWEAQIGKHYSLPMVSVRDVVLPELKAGRLTWNELFADGVHPNDAGHALTADLLTSFFKMAYSKFTADKSSHSPIRVPPPLISDRFEHVLFLDRADLRPLAANGWKFNGANRTDLRWESSQPGSTIEFQIGGTDLYLYFWRVKGPMGKASVSVDGAAPAVLDAWFDQTWGGYIVPAQVGINLKPGTHIVRVTLLNERHPQSTGNQFYILGLGGTNVKTTGRDPSDWPFDANDPWNHPIGSNAKYVAVEKGFHNSKSPNQPVVNCLQYSVPVFFAAEKDPIREVRTWYGDQGGQYLGKIHAPAEARPSEGTDAHMTIISETRDTVVELGVVTFYGPGNFNAWLAFKNDLRGPGVYPAIHGVRAYGGSALGGLIRKGELTHGIPHALALATSMSNLNSKAPGSKTYVWPACSSDYEFPQSLWPPNTKPYHDWYGKSGNLYMGTLLAIPPEVDITTIGIGSSGPTFQIARALQDFGGYIADMGEAPLAFYADHAAADELGGVEKLKKHGGGAALEVTKLLPYLRIVANNTPETIGGGGMPRRSPAPPFVTAPR